MRAPWASQLHLAPKAEAAVSNPEASVRAIRHHSGAGGAHLKTIKKIAFDTRIYFASA
jgi:hypothetical protein